MSLKICGLSLEIAGKKILNSVDLDIQNGKIHVLMGPNGSGKSTLAQTVMGNPLYCLTKAKIESNVKKSYTSKSSGKIYINGKDVTSMSSDKRAKLGLFLAFQNPVSISGVSVANLLRTAYRNLSKKKTGISHNPALSIMDINERIVNMCRKLAISKDLLNRNLNDDFSGGEKKKIEMLQALLLNPRFVVFDEIDTGLDVDSLKIVASTIDIMKKKGAGVLIITHYARILKYAKPDFVHILIKGKIVESGGYIIARNVEKMGYAKWLKN